MIDWKILISGLIIGVFLGWAGYALTHKSECVTGTFVIQDDIRGGMIGIGEIQLCGQGLYWSAIYGPSIEKWKVSNAK